MLRFTIPQMLKLRIINHPVGFLMNNGFPRQTAYRICSGKAKNLTSKQLEKLCLALKCTPNDIIEWIPDDDKLLESNPPLARLFKAQVPYELRDIAKDIPFDKLHAFNQKLDIDGKIARIL